MISMSNYIPRFYLGVTIHPCSKLDAILANLVLVKEAPGATLEAFFYK